MFQDPLPDENITIARNPDSGSEDYNRGKVLHGMTEALLDKTQMLQEGAIAKVLGSDVAAVAVGMFWAPYKIWRNAVEESSLLSSSEIAEAMIKRGKALGEDTNIRQRLIKHDRGNLEGCFVTHNRGGNREDPLDGSINITDPHVVIRYLRHARAEERPNILLTASHALTRDHYDISGVMKGFHALGMHSYEEKEMLPLVRKFRGGQALTVDSADAVKNPRHTVMLSSVHAHENAYVNGGMLLRRLNNLEKCFQNSLQFEQLDPRTLSPEEYFEDMSPAARRLGKFILTAMVDENYWKYIDMDSEEPITAASPIPLLHTDECDARHMAQCIKLMGYSKGGNVIRDAARYAAYWLHAKIPDSDTSLFQVDKEVLKTEETTEEKYKTFLMANIDMLCVNPGITPFSVQEREIFGLRSRTIHNRNDKISKHLFAKHDYKEGVFGRHDDRIEIDGKENPELGDSELGHGLVPALGNKERPGYLLDQALAVQPEKVALIRNQLQVFFASCYNRVAISDIRFERMDDGKADRMIVEFAPGISGTDQAKARRVMNEMQALQEHNIQVKWDKGERHCKILVHGKDVIPRGEEQLQVLAGLQKIFKSLAKQTIDGRPFIISRAIEKEINQQKKQNQSPERGGGAAKPGAHVRGPAEEDGLARDMGPKTSVA